MYLNKIEYPIFLYALVFYLSSLIFHILWSSVSLLLFHRVADFIKGFANRVTIEISKYYAEYSIVATSFNLLLHQNNFFGKSLTKVVAGPHLRHYFS